MDATNEPAPMRRRLRRKTLPLLSALCLALITGGCWPGGGRPPRHDADPVDAQEAVLAAFDDHDIVGGFSASHGNKEVDDFLLDLVRNPELPEVVDDIVVECGNVLYQGVLDRYVAGEDVPLAEVRQVWRNTTGPNCGFSTFYEQLIPLVRRVNLALPEDGRVRVLASDPPIDWSQVDSPDDRLPFEDRDASIAAVIEREVLERDRQALLLFGFRHLQHDDSDTPRWGSAVEQYEAHGYEGVTYVIADHRGFGNNSPLGEDNDELEARMASWPRPSIVDVEGSWLGDIDSGYFDEEPGEDGYPGIDGYLYVGPRDSLLREPRAPQALLDEPYLAELRRRAAAVGEADGPMNPDAILRSELEAGAFSYEPR